MKRIGLLLLTMAMVGLALAACGGGEPANHLEAIKDAGKLVVGTSADFPPFEYVDEAGNFVGFDMALADAIGEKLGVDIEIADMPFDSLLAAVQEGKIDVVIAALNYTPERDENVDFTDPYLESTTVLVVAEGFEGSLETEQDVAQYVLGVQTGSVADAWAVETLVDAGLMADENIFRYERVDQGILDLKAGRIDIFLVDNTPAEAFAAEMGGLEVVYMDESIMEPQPLNIALPEGDSELQAELNSILAELKDEGTITELELEWIYAE